MGKIARKVDANRVTKSVLAREEHPIGSVHLRDVHTSTWVRTMLI